MREIAKRLRGPHRVTQFNAAGVLESYDASPAPLDLEAAIAIERLCDLVECLIDNDPNDYAADAVTVLDVWRKDARSALGISE